MPQVGNPDQVAQGNRDSLNAGLDAIAQGIAFKGATLDELAATLGMEPATLQGTVETYNAACEAGEDAAFGKKPEYLDKIGEGPYYAVEMASYSYNTCAGLDINEKMQVLDVNGNVIPGLYAAGEVTGGLHGANRLGGNAIVDFVVFGKLAGENAAK